MVGPQAYQAYMSPYQQDVIDTSLREYDIQAQKGLPGLAAQAISAGAFGGGREGVQRAEYQATSDRNRAALQAQLLQQGYGQAQQAAAQAFGQQQQLSAGQLGLGQAQMGLASAYPSLLGQQIASYSTLGAQQQAQEQARLQAQQNLAYQQAYQPLQAAQTFGQGVTGLIAGYPGQTRTQIDPSPSALQTGLSAASTLAGIYRAFNPPASTTNTILPNEATRIMSRILKRPMFRRGGEVGGGIMTGIRQNFAEAGSATDRLLEAYAAYPVQSVDPVAKLLISGGLRGLSTTGGGGTLGNLAKAFQEPTERLFEDIGAQDKGRRDLAMIGTKMDIEQENALRIAQAKLKAENAFLKSEPVERAFERIAEANLKAANENKYGKPNIIERFPLKTAAYATKVLRRLDVSDNPKAIEIRRNNEGLLDWDKNKQEFIIENMIPNTYYYNPDKQKFVYLTLEDVGDKLLKKYFLVDPETYETTEGSTEEVPKKKEPTRG
jgi:hypothetical protein